MKNKRFGVILEGQDGTYYKRFILATDTLQRARELAGEFMGMGANVAIVEIIPGGAIGCGKSWGMERTDEIGGEVKILEERKAAMV